MCVLYGLNFIWFDSVKSIQDLNNFELQFWAMDSWAAIMDTVTQVLKSCESSPTETNLNQNVLFAKMIN